MDVVPESNHSVPAADALDQQPSDPAEVAELRRVAIHLAQTAAAHVRTRRPEVFGSGRGEDAVQSKSTPTDPVTIVDTETEQLIRALLAELRPGDHVLG
ncbi:inositol monophosphatase, partial [Nocardia gipuzkoensis]